MVKFLRRFPWRPGPSEEAPVARAPAADVPEVELTPFIDIVFQLLVFLLVANDLSRREVDDLLLPAAPHAAEDPGAPAGRLVVNVPADPPGEALLARVGGVALDEAALLRRLREHAALHGPGAADGGPSILVRADRECPWSRVRAVLAACGAPGVGIRRVAFATDGDSLPAGGR